MASTQAAAAASSTGSNPWTYINQVAPWAVDTQAQYGVPASVTIAQSILESGWGQSGLTVQGNAYFGIKCSPNGYMSPWQNSCLDFPTQEWSSTAGYYTIHSYFRGYATAQNSFKDHGLFLVENSRYASAFSTTNSDDFIRQVAYDGYATDPNYANSVIGIMQSYDLYMYDSPGWQIQALYGQMGGSSSYLGSTTTDITCGLVNGGCWQGFDGGIGYWSPATGAHMVHGAILGEFRSLGYERSSLGFPTGDETCGIKNGGCYQFFQGGVIYWSASTGAHANQGAIRGEYASLGYEHSNLGLPTTDEVCGIKDGGCYQLYEGGAIYWSPATGAHVSWGAIRGKYGALGFEGSALGLPTTDEVCGIKDGGCYQLYEGGAIYWSPTTGTHVNWGAIRAEYASLDYEHSNLGLPTSDEQCGIKNGGCRQLFEGGVIYWSVSTGAHVSWGAIRAEYVAVGDQGGKLGLPTSDEICGIKNGGCYQLYEGGVTYWSSSTGAHVVWGAIGATFQALGAEKSALGLPTSDEICGIKNSGCYQLYQGGAMYWSGSTGAHESIQPLRTYYTSIGSEHSSLGLPTGGQVTNADGSVTQTYEGGRLIWTKAAGVRIG